jgi:DNA-binding NtrC family response regulator
MPGKKPQQFELEKPSKDFFHILVVDDEPVARNLLRSILQMKEYDNIDDADSGPAALDALSRQEYHVVLLDKNMPGLDGIEVLKQAKPKWPQTEFIMITAYGSMETAIEAMDLGAYSYVTKPFSDVEIIARRVAGALERVSIRRENEILLDRLRMVLSDLEQAEGELARLRRAAGSQADSEIAQMGKVRDAVERLRQLADGLLKLSERAKGAAANLIGKMGQEVARVADQLAPHDSRHKADN